MKAMQDNNRRAHSHYVCDLATLHAVLTTTNEVKEMFVWMWLWQTSSTLVSMHIDIVLICGQYL